MKTKLLILLLISFFATAQNKKFLSKAEEQKIYETLKSKAVYDKETEVSYIFEAIEENEKIRYVAQKHNIFYATPNVLNLYIENEKNPERLKTEGNTIKKVAEKVYQVKVTGNMQKAKENFQKKQGVKYVVYEYFAYTNACITWNDPQATNTWGGGYGQLHLSNVDWIAFGYPNGPTHAIDSVGVWKQMHTISNVANPNVISTVIDGGIDVNNNDFSGNVVYAYDYSNNVAGNTITNSTHGTKVTAQIVAKANNNYGGVGIAHDFPLISLDCGNDIGVVTSSIYSSHDYIYSYALNNPNTKQIVNMSFSGGNDPIAHAKIQQAFNLQNNSQVFFVSAAGNSGNSAPINTLASWEEVFAIGAVRTDDQNKTLWSGSCTGSTLDFVADGQNMNLMSSNGTFSTGNNGTSFASPIVAGAIAHLVAQDPTANFQTIYNRLKGGAKDLGTAGFDNSYGWGYARTASSLKYAVVEDVPSIVDCGGNSSYTYNFTPKFYNHATKTVNRKCYYPNGTQVPFVTNGDGTVTFNVVINTNNGFSSTNPAINRLRYEFYPLGYTTCLTSIKSKPITITNLSALSNQEFNEVSLNAYPNPVKDNLYIDSIESLQLENKVQIYDLQGRLVNQINFSFNNENLKVDMSNLSSGMYFVQLQSKTDNLKIKTIKILKE